MVLGAVLELLGAVLGDGGVGEGAGAREEDGEVAGVEAGVAAGVGGSLGLRGERGV